MEKLTAKVLKKVQNTPDVVTLHFTVGGKVLDYVAGQYVTVYFDDTSVKTGKAYSLSSAPGDKAMSITVKNIGLFSGKLHSLELGDEFLVSKPYGFFNVKNDLPIVAIAAGVGISPIWSIIRDELDTGRPIELLYSNKTEKDIVFKQEIGALRPKKNFKVRHFVTRENNGKYISRRIDSPKILGPHEPKRNYYICGSQDFVSAMWGLLSQAGVGEAAISTETFFENQ